MSAIIIIIGLLGLCAAYPTGPPASTCMTLFPKHHNAEQQSSASPYRLVLSSDTYTPGQNITVWVESTVAQKSFKGFQVVVHRVKSSGNAEEFIGTFSATDPVSTTVDCKDTPRTMLAHNSSTQKFNVSGMWTAPSTNQGDLQFFLTVVESTALFWSRIPFSLKATAANAVSPPTVTVPPVMTSPTPPDWKECGVSKGCWMVPAPGSSSCSGIQDCKAVVSYRLLPAQDKYQFEMSVKGQNLYISVGFSEDKMMGDDQTVTCISNAGFETVQLGYNPGKRNDRAFTAGLSSLTTGHADGQTYCTFVRAASIDIPLNKTATRYFNINNPYFLLLAWGPIANSTDVLVIHTEKPAISEMKVNMSAIATMGRPSSEANSPLLKNQCYTFVLLLMLRLLVL